MAITHCMYFQAGFLKCHPDQFAHDPYTKYAAWIDNFFSPFATTICFKNMNILSSGSTSTGGTVSSLALEGASSTFDWIVQSKECKYWFLISIHSIAHPLSLNGLAPWGSKRVCRASPYSPSTPGNVPFRCRLPFHSSCFLLSGGARQTSASQIWTTPPSGLSSAESMLKRAW